MSVIDQFLIATSAAGLRHPMAGPSLTDSPLYGIVRDTKRTRFARADAFMRGKPLNGRRLDSFTAADRMDSAGKAIDAATLAYNEAVVAEWTHEFARQDGHAGNTSRMDALVPNAVQALEFIYPEVYEFDLRGFSTWDGLYLKIDRSIDPAAETYIRYERDVVGIAKVGSTYATTTIPLVAGPIVNFGRGNIIPFLVGMQTNFMEARRVTTAINNGKPDFKILEGQREACDRSLRAAAHFTWLFGDVASGINGLFTHPDIQSYSIVGAWAGKSPIARFGDLIAMANIIPNSSGANPGDRLGDTSKIRILLPPAAYDLLHEPMTAAGTQSILAYFLDTMGKGAPEIIKNQEGAAANSQLWAGGPQGLSVDTGMIIYDQGKMDRDPTFKLPQDVEVPMPPRQDGLGETTFYHMRVGGVEVPDARGIYYVTGF